VEIKIKQETEVVRKEVKTYVEKLMCKTCNVEMKPEGCYVYLTYPAQYPYKCNSCGMKLNTTKQYPFLVHE
jgi:primosomal protein N'